MHFDPRDYGPVLGRLVDADRRRPLDAGTAAAGMGDKLRGLSMETAFDHARVLDRNMASCCISGVWLVYDFLDESHTISQSIHTPSGSFWHGIMHRREGDFSNAKYWFRRGGAHPIEAGLAAAAREFAALESSDAARELADRDAWDPCRFVDLCQAAVRGKPAEVSLLERVQQAEWEILFDFCYWGAVGPT